MLLAPAQTISASTATATVSFSYSAPSLLVNVVSSVGVGGWQVEVDIPSGVSVESASESGFMTGASTLFHPPQYRWFNLGANGQTTGTLTIPVTYSGVYTITLSVADLTDVNAVPIAVSPTPPIILMTSTITLSPSSASRSLGQSITFSGGITQAPPAGTMVIISYSLDSGATWNIFITTQTDMTGSYSATWYPPYSAIYQIEASWSGSTNTIGSTSSPVTLTVTGTRPPQISLLVTGPGSATRGLSATFDVIATNSSSSIRTTVLYLEVIGPGGYYYFDTTQISAPAGRSARFQFTWQIPSSVQAGSYQVNVGLIPPTPTSISQAQIAVN